MSEQNAPAALVDQPAEAPVAPQPETPAEPALVVEDLLVEEVSIDGMCGVY